MNVGIIEICVDGHYMIVNTLVKTYLEDKNNTIFLYITPFVFKILENEISNHPRIKVFILNIDVDNFFNKVINDNLDRVHFNSVTNFYKNFYKFSQNFKGKVYFHFHNIDLWFMSTFSWEIKRLFGLFFKVNIGLFFRETKYSIKQFFRGFFQKKLIKLLLNRQNTFFVILSEAQKFHLNKYISNNENVIIFPSIIFEENKHKDLSNQNIKLRVCVPGSVSQTRRQYFELFKVIKENYDFFSQNIVFDFLGFLPQDQLNIELQIKMLIDEGIDIIYYKSFIDDSIFDENLYKADVILSNIHVFYNTKSPQNKETATVYNMIRCGKPGLFPKGFVLDSVFDKSVLKFNDYEDLKLILEELILNNSRLTELKKNALELSKKYSAIEMLKLLYLT